MTALQWIVKEAKSIKKKYPKRFSKWTEYVAQASAIYASKHKGKSPVGKKKAAPKKKKVGVIKSKPYKGYQYTIDENETGDFVDKYFTLSEAKKDLKRLISKDKKSGKYKKDFYRITHINTGKTIYGVKASKEIKKVLAKKGLKMPHGYSTTKRVRKVSGVKKKISEQSILNKIHRVKDDVNKLDEAQHKHMLGRLTKIMGSVSGKYYINYTTDSGYKKMEFFNKLPKGYYKGMDRIIYVTRLTNHGTSLIPVKLSNNDKDVKK